MTNLLKIGGIYTLPENSNVKLKFVDYNKFSGTYVFIACNDYTEKLYDNINGNIHIVDTEPYELIQ